MSYLVHRPIQVLLQRLEPSLVRQTWNNLLIRQRNSFTLVGCVMALCCCFAINALCQTSPTRFSVLEPLDPSDMTIPGNVGVSYGINNMGDIVGYCFPHGFISDGHKMTLLGALGGRGSAAYAVNDIKEVTGRASVLGNSQHAFLFNRGKMVDLNTLDDGLGGSIGLAINNFGQVAGESTASGAIHAFLWTPVTAHGMTGTMVDLGLPDDIARASADGDSENDALPSESNNTYYFSHAFGINDKGQVTGEFTVAGIQHAFLWTPSTTNGTGGKMIDLGSLSPTGQSSGHSINNNGEVVGYSKVVDVTRTGYKRAHKHSFLFSNGVMRDLGVPGNFYESQAVGINNKGQILVIGSLNRNREYYMHQYGENPKDEGYFLLDHDKMLDLDRMLTSGKKPLGGVWGINDRCQIAASIFYGSTGHAVLLTPDMVPLVRHTPKKLGGAK